MCDANKFHIDALNCDYVIENSGKGEYVVKGQLLSNKKEKIIFYAANPATYNGSFSGSGLPFANPNMAFENTPNNGTIYTNENGEFEFKVFYPNSYYVALGTIYVSPHVFIKKCGDTEVHSIYLGDGIPFRMLTYPNRPFTIARKCPLFYAKGGRQLHIRSQEQILRDSEYPIKNKMPENFWGKAIQHP